MESNSVKGSCGKMIMIALCPASLIVDFDHGLLSDETAKWEKITYLGIATCTVLSIYNLSKGHPHHEEPPVSFLF